MGEWPNRATQFKPGQSGNPSGKSKARVRAESLFDATTTDAHIKKLLRLIRAWAEDGEPWAVEMLMKRYLPATERREVEQVEPAPVHELEAALDRLDGAREKVSAARKPNGSGANGSSRGSS